MRIAPAAAIVAVSAQTIHENWRWLRECFGEHPRKARQIEGMVVDTRTFRENLSGRIRDGWCRISVAEIEDEK
jgi:hypothetical protein